MRLELSEAARTENRLIACKRPSVLRGKLKEGEIGREEGKNNGEM